MNPRQAVGIDLGTSNTVTAVVNSAGNTQIVRDTEGQWRIPALCSLTISESWSEKSLIAGALLPIDLPRGESVNWDDRFITSQSVASFCRRN